MSIDLNRPIYVYDNIDLEELCSGWIENDNSYMLKSTLGEFIHVNKYNRLVTEEGYSGLIFDWYHKGFVYNKIDETPYSSDMEDTDVSQVILFPQTIGTRTFYTAQELIEYVLESQELQNRYYSNIRH